MELGVLPSPCRALIEYICSLTPAWPLLGKANFTAACRELMPPFTSIIRIMARRKYPSHPNLPRGAVKGTLGILPQCPAPSPCDGEIAL